MPRQCVVSRVCCSSRASLSFPVAAWLKVDTATRVESASVWTTTNRWARSMVAGGPDTWSGPDAAAPIGVVAEVSRTPIDPVRPGTRPRRFRRAADQAAVAGAKRSTVPSGRKSQLSGGRARPDSAGRGRARRKLRTSPTLGLANVRENPEYQAGPVKHFLHDR